MRAWLIVGLLAAVPAWGQEPSAREAITTLYKLVPELLAARACGFRDRAWYDRQLARIQGEAHAIAGRSLAAFQNDQGDADEFIRGAQDQAVADGAVETNRFRQQACQALQAGGRLAALDAMLN